MFAVLLCAQQALFAQSFKAPQKFRSFTKMQLNYGLGINDVVNNQKVNPFQIKFMFGKQNEFFGAALGIATGNYKNNGSNGGLNMNTLAFSANGHYLLRSVEDYGSAPFLKAGIGYAPKIFREYAKGLNYDAGAGYVFTNKKGGKYFAELQYHTQRFENFYYQGNNLKAESIGLGVGLWF